MSIRLFKTLQLVAGVACFAVCMTASAKALSASSTATAPHCLWDLGTTCRDVNCIENNGTCVGVEEDCHCRLPETK